MLSMRRWLWIAALAAAAPAGAAQWQTVLQADLEGGVVSVPQDTNSGVSGTLLGDVDLAPALKFDNGGLLNPLIYASANGQSRPIDEETLYVRSYALGMRPTYTHTLGWTLLGGGWSAGARLLATHVWNQEALDETFGQGVYDYEEFGGGLLLRKAAGSLDDQLNLDFSHRDYPNYHDPGADVTGDRNYYVKDSYFWRLGFRHRDRLSDDKVLTANVRLSERDYTDSYVVSDVDGTLTGQKQNDLDANVDLGLAWRLGQAWSVDFGLGYDQLASNQNLFDTGVAPAQATENGDNFYDLRIDPGLHWLSGPWSAGATYELLLRQTNHYIQDPDGTYTEGLQADVEHGLSLSADRALGAGLKVRADFAAREVLSNQEFAHGTLASYSYYNAGLGLVYAWQSGAH